VTGSQYLLKADGKPLLIDCGLFQGLKELRLRNWQPPPFGPGALYTFFGKIRDVPHEYLERGTGRSGVSGKPTSCLARQRVALDTLTVSFGAWACERRPFWFVETQSGVST
jgi:hypothetical protein